VRYAIAERFKSIQGEGVFAGMPMAFIRFVGCSVGKRICSACDTDFEKMHNWHGGGMYDEEELRRWAQPYKHICLTGGEPLDQDLQPLVRTLWNVGAIIHVETSGTKAPSGGFLLLPEQRHRLWLCVSPKPGFSEVVITLANEVKVIVPGLGGPQAEGWPTIEDALRWADAGKVVFLQPRNAKHDVDKDNLQLVMDLISEHPQLRLSVQLHKLLRVR
jgi:7-carboxy-7-deazaguanine synthase